MILKAVGFDIDGTLYPDRQAHLRSLSFLFVHTKIILAFSQTRRHMRRHTRPQAMLGNDWEIALFAEKLKTSVPQAQQIRDDIIYKKWETYFQKIRPYPQVRESLIRLKKAGLKIAALSDFPVGQKLHYFGIADLFDLSIGYPDSQELKPHSQPFLLMAQGLGLDPAEILYIGNKLDYDARGAQKAGLRAALINIPARKSARDVPVYKNYPQLTESILLEVNA